MSPCQRLQGAEVRRRPVQAVTPRRLSTNPVVCLTAMTTAFIVRQVSGETAFAVSGLATTFVSESGLPVYVGIEPDPKRGTALQRLAKGWQVRALVGGVRSYSSSSTLESRISPSPFCAVEPASAHFSVVRHPAKILIAAHLDAMKASNHRYPPNGH
jgi:hypothetical protein